MEDTIIMECCQATEEIRVIKNLIGRTHGATLYTATKGIDLTEPERLHLVERMVHCHMLAKEDNNYVLANYNEAMRLLANHLR